MLTSLQLHKWQMLFVSVWQEPLNLTRPNNDASDAIWPPGNPQASTTRKSLDSFKLSLKSLSTYSYTSAEHRLLCLFTIELAI